MPIVAGVDGVARRIYLSADTMGAEVHPIDIYKEVRALRRTDESLRKFDNFLEASGNVAKGGGKFTPRLVICRSGTRIVPYNNSHELTITGEIITDDEQSGVACFDKTTLTGVEVDINYIPPQVEIIAVSGGTGTAPTESQIYNYFTNGTRPDVFKADVSELETQLDEQTTQLREIWQFLGLDMNNPMTVSQILRSVSTIEIEIIRNADGSVTLQRHS